MIQLPPTFADIKLSELWYFLKTCDELRELSASEDDKKYWAGWHDCMSTLLGDLTSRPTAKLDKELAYIFEDFRAEDRLADLADEIKDRDGL